MCFTLHLKLHPRHFDPFDTKTDRFMTRIALNSIGTLYYPIWFSSLTTESNYLNQLVATDVSIHATAANHLAAPYTSCRNPVNQSNLHPYLHPLISYIIPSAT